MSEREPESEHDDEPVPKLPRGRGFKFNAPELFRIAITVCFLVAVIVLTRPCASAVSTFVMGFEGSNGSAAAKAGSAAPPGTPAGLGSGKLIPLRGMTDDQVRETVERAQGKLGSGSAGSAGSATGSN